MNYKLIIVSAFGSAISCFAQKTDALCIEAMQCCARGEVSAAAPIVRALSAAGEEGAARYAMFTNGLIVATCDACKGIGFRRVPCRRCEGTGDVEMLKGTRGRCLLCSGRGYHDEKCLSCSGRGEAVSTNICAWIERAARVRAGCPGGIGSEGWRDIESAVVQAKARMALAERLTGSVLQVLPGGLLVNLGAGGETVYVAGHSDSDQIVDGAQVSMTVYPDGRYKYESVSGAVRTIRRYALNPFSGLR